MQLIITIDTEEDNWARYSVDDNPVSNIEKLVSLQKLFDEYNVRPTYLITYPVATNFRSIEILKRILKDSPCEIGMHCHPWNTPPVNNNETIRENNTMLCNLPEDIVHQKLSVLHKVIQSNFGITPVSFRAGRWGFSSAVASSLCQLGYRVDTSVSPYTDWTAYYGPNFSKFSPKPFRFSVEGVDSRDNEGQLLQIPATVGFLQPNFDLCEYWMEMVKQPVCRKLHIAGILDRLRLLNKVWLSPELSSADDMIKLARRMKKKNYSFLNLTFHSVSLKAGLSPFVRTQEDERIFFKKIKKFLTFIRDERIDSCTLSEIEEDFLKHS